MKKIALSIVFISLSFAALTQTTSGPGSWKRIRQDISFGIGASNFLGDLGGLNQIGTHYSLKDLEFSLTRPDFFLAYRYKIIKQISFRANFFYGRVNGDDKLTKEPYRNARNLNFRSPIIEFSSQLEFAITPDAMGRKTQRYKLKGAKSGFGLNLHTYVFVGIGFFYFNPQGEYKGQWYNLQPMGTEGQGIEPGTKKYSRLAMAIPFGIGFKHRLNYKWSIGLELGLRKTNTDYIDDVSTVYYDKETIRQNYGDMAAHFADPSILDINAPYKSLGSTTAPGQTRGNPKHKDSYIFSWVSISYNFKKGGRTRSKF